MDSLERVMQPMHSAIKKPSDRSRVVSVNRDAYKITKKLRLSDSGIKRDTDLNGGPSAGSKNSSAAGFQLVKSTDQISNPFSESSSPNTSPAFLKSNSAIAAQGYVGKSTM